MNFSTETQCPICGGCGVDEHNILWPQLIADWRLSPEETSYINRQQGSLCRQCGGNIRSGVIAKAFCTLFDQTKNLDQLLESPPIARTLEVNEAGTLHERLKQLPKYHFAKYPECDLMAMPFDDDSFDIIIHSDTLEHVLSPQEALKEIRRVLIKGGSTIFTVPTLLGRLTRSRDGLPHSYHGAEGTNSPDLLVYYEFGSDVWCMVLEAGFSECRIISHQYPAGIAILAIK